MSNTQKLADIKSNPIRSRQDWLDQRAQVESDPGAFHGEIAKREIFWLNRSHNLWIKKTDESNWTGVDATSGLKITEISLPADYLPWDKGFDASEAPFFRWFDGGMTNACFNEVDQHVIYGFGAETAFIFEGEDWNPLASNGKGAPLVQTRITRQELFVEVARHAVALINLGLKKGDRIAINMPNIPEQVFYIEAAKRLGIIYTCISGGLGPKTIADRIADIGAAAIITSSGAHNGGLAINFKKIHIDEALLNFVPVPLFLERISEILEITKNLSVHDRKQTIEILDKALAGELTVDRVDFSRLMDATKITSQKLLDELKDGLESLVWKIASVIVVRHAGINNPDWTQDRDHWSHELTAEADRVLAFDANARDTDLVKAVYRVVPPVPVESNYPLFVIYTSGSTGKPKGIVHTHGGFLSGIVHTMRVCFDVMPGDGQTIFVIADPGWITGQSYMISAALVMRTTSLLLEGSPVYPYPTRFASIIEHHKVNILKAGSTFLKAFVSDPSNLQELSKFDLSSLRVATFCAEPLNPSIQELAMSKICSRYINSYWATEHGGIILTHFFGNEDFELAPDTRMYPLPWIFADVWISKTDAQDQDTSHPASAAQYGEKGDIVLLRAYPYLARTIWGDAERVGTREWKGDLERFKTTYFDRLTGIEQAAEQPWIFVQGDFACKYDSLAFSLHGRSDDVINTSGHRIGTAEIESAILKDRQRNSKTPIRNVVVVGGPHNERGSVPVAFVVTHEGKELSSEDIVRISDLVREEKGITAVPVAFILVSALPETRSGKYLRRALKALLEGEDAGDTSTLKNPECLTSIGQSIAEWKQSSATSVQPSSASRLEDLPEAERRAALITLVKDEIARLVGLKSGRELTDSTQFISIGLDSMKAMEFRNQLKLALGEPVSDQLSPMLAMQYPTADELVNFLMKAYDDIT